MPDFIERNANIRKLRKPKFILKQIAKMHGITSERVRQLLNKEPLRRCSIHRNSYGKTCKYCDAEVSHKTKLEKLDRAGLMTEIERLSQRGRDGKTVLERKLLVRKLVEEHGLSYLEIGRLLHRHHTTIIHLYKNSQHRD